MEETIAINTRSLSFSFNQASGAIAIAAMQIASVWPIWFWYFQRIHDRSDEPYGLLALATITLYILSEPVRHTQLPGAKTLLVSTAFMVAYVLSQTSCPMLFQSCLAVLAVASLLSSMFLRRPFHLPTWGLVLLSLPVVASLQFYAGFPLRILCSDAAAVLLRLSGYMVAQQGTGLLWQGHFIGIDAACSGVKLIWAALYTTFTLAAINGLDNKRTFILCCVAFLTALVGNIFRATSLFFIEVFPKDVLSITLPTWSHDAIGVLIFALMAAFIAAICKVLPLIKWLDLRDNTNEAQRRGIASGDQEMPHTGDTRRIHSGDKGTLHSRNNASRYIIPLFVLVCLITAMSPALHGVKADGRPAYTGTVTPTSFEGATVKRLPLSLPEQAFVSGFPGAIIKLTDGHNQILMRTVGTPTRQLHPSEDCFKGLGYSIHPVAGLRDCKGQAWGRFEATDGATHLIVREIILDKKGNSWSDVSAWFWSAFVGKTQAPWTAITVATPVEARVSNRYSGFQF